MPTTLLTRISNMDRDRRNINGVYEKGDVIKRPGVATTNYNYANHQGALGMQGFLITVYDDMLDVFDYVPMPPPVYIGDLVGGYYAMVDNPSTSPGPGDPYWSATPPGTDRWRGYFGYFYYVAAIFPANRISEPAASKDAAAKLLMETRIATLSPGLALLDGNYNPPVGRSYTFPSPSVWTRSGNFISTEIYADQVSLFSYPSDWPSGVPWGNTYHNASLAIAYTLKRQVLSSFTLTAVGSVASIRLSTTVLGSTFNLSPDHVFEISGCDQPEFNGTHYASLTPDPSNPQAGDFTLYSFNLSGTPASSPATGASKQLAYYSLV